MSTPTYDFHGHAALVTGATKGIGREVSLSLAKSGCAVAATGRNRDELESLRQEIESAGGSCRVLVADLSSADECIAMAEHFVGAMPDLDLVVNNAGASFPELLVDMSVEHWDATLNVNLRAPALVMKVLSKHLIARGGGAVVNVSSQAGVIGLTEHAAYCASKWGLNGLTKVLALELGPYNVRVNAVAPTVVLTPMGQKVWGDPAKSEPMLAKIPLAKFAYPPDVANAVLYLLSDAASMITGEVMVIDGGYTAQ